MRRPLVIAALGLGLVSLSAAEAQTLRERIRARIAERMAERWAAADQDGPQAPTGKAIAYGRDPLQTLDFWPAVQKSSPTEKFANVRPAPLIVFVHGGGWKRGSKDNATGKWKPVHFPESGYAFASINYRLVPAARVEDQAADVALAVKALVDRAVSLGIDPHRVVLMGHSAGAHLVALVGTDERYLRAAGLSFANVAGVIPIDGAAYDVAAQMQDGPGIMKQTYLQAFGNDPTRQRQLSPTLQAAAPNAPAFLLLHVRRPDGVRQAKALEAALKSGGTAVERRDFPGEGLQGHAQINRSLGDPTYPATAVVDDWLQRITGR